MVSHVFSKIVPSINDNNLVEAIIVLEALNIAKKMFGKKKNYSGQNTIDIANLR